MPIIDRSGYSPLAAKTIQVFSSPGTFTWNRPQGCIRVRVSLVGAGGGGAGYCEAGGSGGYSESYIDVTNIETVAVTVGTGGNNVGYYGVAVNGTSSSFGSYLSASGGYGANAHQGHEGGMSGYGNGGQLNLYGGKGSGHGNSMGSWGPNTGGDSYFGGSHGRKHSSNDSNDDQRHCAWGAGGTGARTDAAATASSGAHGAVVIYEYYNS